MLQAIFSEITGDIDLNFFTLNGTEMIESLRLAIHRFDVTRIFRIQSQKLLQGRPPSFMAQLQLNSNVFI